MHVPHPLSTSALLLFVLLAPIPLRPVMGNCQEIGAAFFSLELQSQRNATGHRNVKVTLRTRVSPSGAADLGGLQISQSAHMCEAMQYVDTVATITAPPTILTAPAGYEVFPGLGYYKFHTTPVVWDEAYLTCVREGTHMLFLTSEAEANVLKQFLGRKNVIEGATWTTWAWAGFHDRGLEGFYVTVTGIPLNTTGYTKWHSGQPDNKPWGTEPDQDCGSFNKEALLNDLPCLGKLPFICKQSM